MFPFVLPCFAPTAVPQVLPFWIPPPGSVPDFRFLFVCFRFSISLLSHLFFLFHSLPVLASQVAFPVLLFRSRFPDLSPSFRPGFPCLLSGSVYLAFCQFPFILPSFASHSCSTGDHLLLSPSVLSPSFPLSFVHFFSGSDYLAFAFSFPFFPASPCLGTSGADLSVSLPACYHAFRSTLVLSLAAFPFNRFLFRYTAATSDRNLVLSVSVIPLS